MIFDSHMHSKFSTDSNMNILDAIAVAKECGIYKDGDVAITNDEFENIMNNNEIVFLEINKMIMEKYKEHPECIKKGVVLPVPSNQRMNSYLKEIADVCGIKKTLSTHIARHTFACVAIANKVSMESIAKMLGHTDIRTTKIYARLMDRTVSEEMNVLRQKFSV